MFLIKVSWLGYYKKGETYQDYSIESKFFATIFLNKEEAEEERENLLVANLLQYEEDRQYFIVVPWR